MEKYKWHNTDILKCYTLRPTMVLETADRKETPLGIIIGKMKWYVFSTKIDSTLKLMQ